MSKKLDTATATESTTPTETVVDPFAHINLPSNLNVSQTIRYLSAEGLKRGQICKFFEQKLGRTIRYQHVRNVLITPLKTTSK